MSSAVHIEITKPIATLCLVGMERRRVIDGDTWRELATAFDDISARSDVSCVVVCGTGRRPFTEDSHTTANDILDHEREDSAAMTRALRAVGGCPHPTVAVVEGLCVGGALEIAACCDLRVCGESSRFGVPTRRTASIGPHDPVQPLTQLLGASPALDTLLGGGMIDAEQASACGLVNRVCPDATVLARGYGIAARIAAGAPLVNPWHKNVMRRLHARLPRGEIDQVDLRDSPFRAR